MATTMFVCVAAIIFSVFQVDATPKSIKIDRQTNDNLFEGDIVMTPKQKLQRNGILKAQRWPNGVIPYDFGTQWATEQTNMIYAAMAAIQASTCIYFVPRSNENDYISIYNTKYGCNTNVGKAGGKQVVSLQHDNRSSCFDHATVVHELLHAVGLWHEQSRYDRDDYLTINWNNIEPSKKHNFEIETAKYSDTYGVPYNFYSVMHYSAYAFSTNDKTTIQAKPDYYTDIIGNAAYGHELDFEKVRRIYECKGTFTPAITTTAAPVMCSDAMTYCKDLVKGDNCKTDDGMNRYCRKTCGHCKDGEYLCQDKVNYCGSYRNDCGSAPWLRDYCAKTCRLC